MPNPNEPSERTGRIALTVILGVCALGALSIVSLVAQVINWD